MNELNPFSENNKKVEKKEIMSAINKIVRDAEYLKQQADELNKLFGQVDQFTTVSEDAPDDVKKSAEDLKTKEFDNKKREHLGLLFTRQLDLARLMQSTIDKIRNMGYSQIDELLHDVIWSLDVQLSAHVNRSNTTKSLTSAILIENSFIFFNNAQEIKRVANELLAK